MYRLIFIVIIQIFLFLSCDYATHSNTELEIASDTLVDKPIAKQSVRLLKSELAFDNEYHDGIIKQYSVENIEKYYETKSGSDWNPYIEYYTRYNAKEWLWTQKPIHFDVNSNNFQKQHPFFDDKFNWTEKCRPFDDFNVMGFEKPLYAGVRALSFSYWGINRHPSLSLSEASQSIGDFGLVWMSDIERPYGYGDMHYHTKYEASHFLTGEEATEVISSNKEYFVDYIFFCRDNCCCFISATNKHSPLKEDYNIYDFAREIDRYIQAAKTVKEYKPAKLTLNFENFNVDTYTWEPAKSYLQPAFIDEEIDDEEDIIAILRKKANRDFGVIDENGKRNYDIDKAIRIKVEEEIEEYIEYPIRLRIDVADQLGNRGGSAKVIDVFKGQPNAKIPEPLTLERINEIYDAEKAKGIGISKRTWGCNIDFDDRELDDVPNTVYYCMPSGRYIFVIDVTTATQIKSRHFYEVYVSDEYHSTYVKEIIEKREELRRIIKAEDEVWEKDKSDKLSKSDEDWEDW